MAAPLVDYGTEHLLDAVVHGYCLHNSIYVPFASLDKPEEWFDPTRYGSIKLKLKGGAGAGAVTVVTQQLRS